MFDIFWEFNFINALAFAAFLTTVGKLRKAKKLAYAYF